MLSGWSSHPLRIPMVRHDVVEGQRNRLHRFQPRILANSGKFRARYTKRKSNGNPDRFGQRRGIASSHGNRPLEAGVNTSSFFPETFPWVGGFPCEAKVQRLRRLLEGEVLYPAAGHSPRTPEVVETDRILIDAVPMFACSSRPSILSWNRKRNDPVMPTREVPLFAMGYPPSLAVRDDRTGE
jgi:hypothetical protein